MARLPIPGSDTGSWGNILNDFLSQVHSSDGSLKENVVGSSQLQDGAVTQSDVGLGDVDNTADVDKPISTQTQAALNTKLTASNNLSELASAATARTNLGLTSTATTTPSALANDAAFTRAFSPYMGSSQQFSLPAVSKKLTAIATAPPARLKVLALGDSYALKVYSQIWPTLVSICGSPAGAYAAGGISGGISINSTSGSVTGNTTDFTRWPSGATDTFSSGASRTYGTGGTSFVANTIKVYYAKEPDGGTFKIQVDGVDAAGFENISAAGTLGQLGIATISTTAGAHTVTIVNLTGSMTIVCVGYENSTISGLVSMSVSQGGIAFDSPTSTAWSNFQAFLADTLPDLMLLEAKENSATWAASLSSIFAATAAGAPTMDVIGIGSTPVASGDADQILQNTQLHAACDAAGYAYWDSYAPFGSYAKLVALGWQGDGTHVATDADRFRGMLLLRDTGLLESYGRNIWQGGARIPSLAFGRNQDQSTTGSIQAETTFGLDLQIRSGRRVSFTNNSGSEFACLDGAGTASWVPTDIRVGSTSNVRLRSSSASLLVVVQGSSNATADLQMKSLVNDAAVSTTSGAITADLSTAGAFWYTLNGNVTSFSFSNQGQSGQLVEICFIQDGTGSRTLSGASASIKWAGGSAPTLSTTANRRDFFWFRQRSGGYYEVSRSMNVSA